MLAKSQIVFNIVKQKSETFLDVKKKKKKKQSQAFKGYASSYNFEFSLSWTTTEGFSVSAKKDQLIDFLTELKVFRFVIKLVLEYKK